MEFADMALKLETGAALSLPRGPLTSMEDCPRLMKRRSLSFALQSLAPVEVANESLQVMAARVIRHRNARGVLRQAHRVAG